VIQTSPESGFRSLGQATAQRVARRSAATGRLGRTLLVHGPPGAGKGAFIDDLLALAFCSESDPERRPCNACRGCRDARARTHPDLVVGSPEVWREMRSTGESIVSAARRWLLEAAGAPVVAPQRIVLIERADRANEQTQNALLKALEEPSDRHAFILVADEPARLLPTIRSRAQPLRIGRVPHADLVAHLVDVERLPEDLADALARIANGLSGSAVAFARSRELIDWRRRLQGELLALLERGRADRFGAARDLLDETTRLGIEVETAVEAEDDGPRTPASVQREAALLLVDAWLSLARDLLVSAAGRPQLAPSSELAPRVREVGPLVGVAPLVRMIALLERVHDGLRANAAPKLALDAAMLAWPTIPVRVDR
jgi:DNA polymerase III subunit delta'